MSFYPLIQSLNGVELISASISLATSFHFKFGELAEDDDVNFILMGFVRSCSVKMVDDVGERTEG